VSLHLDFSVFPSMLYSMKIHYKKWNNINDVPYIILDWAQYIGGRSITIDDVNTLVNEYLDYVSKLDDTVLHETTID
jgi:hypothetical protein